jgi:hypothetical protein
MALLAADRQVQPGQAAKVLADQPQHLRVSGIDPQPGADARPSRWAAMNGR